MRRILELHGEGAYLAKLSRRLRRELTFRIYLRVATMLSIAILFVLFANIVNSAFGMVAIASEVDQNSISVVPLGELSSTELAEILLEHAPNKLRVIIRDELSIVEPNQFTKLPLSEVLSGSLLDDSITDQIVMKIADTEAAKIIADNVDAPSLISYVISDVIGSELLKTWTLTETWFEMPRIQAEFEELVADQNPPNPMLEFRSWISWAFITSPQSAYAELTGIRTAILGSIWIMIITLMISLPVGIGAAIYLEEYADLSNWWGQLIEQNIRNLAGVPSIIYGMLGLAVFVRTLGFITSGQIVGITDSNGRTILSAGLTLALLVLPVIIIASQEAIKAIPESIREAALGMGATKWQLIHRVILPNAMPGILTGTILSLSRAIGETAPLIVIGASAVISSDPEGPFSKFTALPIQIWQWTARPQAEFRNVAAASIIVLLMLLIALLSSAFVLRWAFEKRRQY